MPGPEPYHQATYFTSGYARSNATQVSAITTNTSTLPSGPTEPPVIQCEPWNEERIKCPVTIPPLSGTEYRKLSPQSHAA